MEQIREVAMAYYRRSSAGEKRLANEFFGALDVDGDGRVSLAEYKNVLGSDRLFGVIDQNGDGTLDFEEVLTLYFMNKVCMRNCDACGCFMIGSYFSCLLCEKEFPSCYDLCCACYGGGKFKHRHPAANFLDDRSMRLLLIHFLQKADVQPAQPEPKLSSPAPVQQYSTRSSREEKVKTAFETFDTAVSVGNVVLNIGSAAVNSGCIVM